MSLSEGSLPAREDGLVSRKACVPSASFFCEKIYNVSIQNCGKYNVYYLPRPTACPEAYCFDKEPCNTAKIIPYEPLRRTVYKTLRDETPICDKYNIRKEGEWFRTSNEMVNNSTQASDCGTIHGIWIKGNPPDVNDGIVYRTACVPKNNTACSKTYQIKAKNCGNYSVFFLRRPTSCPEAYCFGYGEPDKMTRPTTCTIGIRLLPNEPAQR
ncbi:oncoprotein-induced transcript 3 protein-like [Saccostrea cucullata]|uniref:oncoprotein-induced transcript 3 protein-like n=1 Tax=Saccostrea cuccullata TaxID=36930 RepID=UPI002ED2ED54